MKFHALIALEKFVLEELAPGADMSRQADLQTCRSLIGQVGKDVKGAFGSVALIPVGNGLVSRQLDLLYKQCRNLSDALHAYGAEQGLRGQLREEVQQALLGLLEHLLERYDELLSLDLQVARLHFVAAVEGLETRLGSIVSLMKQYHVDPGLQAVIVSKISKLRDKGKASWSQIRHLEHIQNYIRSSMSGRYDNATVALSEYLQRSNFNTGGFLLYCKKQFDQLMESQSGPVEAYSKLCDLEKMYKTACYKKYAEPYEPRLPRVKAALLKCVRAEMDCLRKKERGLAKAVIVLNASPPVWNSTGEKGDACEKLSVSLSVEQLTYFFKLLIAVGLVRNPSKASVLRFLARHVETPGAISRDISLKSLDNKYSQVARSTVLAMRVILMKMVRQIDEACP